MSEKNEIIELIERAKDIDGKQAKVILLELYYLQGCKWAKKIINRLVYSNMINPTSGEIASLVYQALETSIKNIKFDKICKTTFKGYFFVMIKYQIFSELKTTLNYKVVNNFQEKVKTLKEETREGLIEDSLLMHNLSTKQTIDEILDFLSLKNEEYYIIIFMKLQGYKNNEICNRLAFTKNSLKSRIQYIKQIIKSEFGYVLKDFLNN